MLDKSQLNQDEQRYLRRKALLQQIEFYKKELEEVKKRLAELEQDQ